MLGARGSTSYVLSADWCVTQSTPSASRTHCAPMFVCAFRARSVPVADVALDRARRSVKGIILCVGWLVYGMYLYIHCLYLYVVSAHARTQEPKTQPYIDIRTHATHTHTRRRHSKRHKLCDRAARSFECACVAWKTEVMFISECYSFRVCVRAHVCNFWAQRPRRAPICSQTVPHTHMSARQYVCVGTYTFRWNFRLTT